MAKKVRYFQGTVAYPGSLITQNFGEGPVKGFLVWDLDSLRSRFVRVDNDWSYITVHVDSYEEAVQHAETNFYSPKTRVRISTKRPLSSAQQEDLKTKFVSKFDLVESPRIVSGKLSEEEHGRLNSEALDQYSDKAFQAKLIRDHVASGDDRISQDTLDKVSAIHDECVRSVEMPIGINSRWQILWLEFDNVGPYGPGNRIDFSSMDGIIGIFAPNRTGKTSLLETLSFAIFGKSFKSPRLINLVKNSMSTSICLRLDGQKYRIDRTLKRNKKGGNNGTVRLVRINDDGSEDPLNDDSLAKTNTIVEQLFGSHSDLFNTSIAGQEKINTLIDSKQADRLATLCRLVNLDFFERLGVVAKAKLDDVSKEIAIIERTYTSDKFHAARTKKEEAEKRATEREAEIEEAKKILSASARKQREIKSLISDSSDGKAHDALNAKKRVGELGVFLSQKTSELEDFSKSTKRELQKYADQINYLKISSQKKEESQRKKISDLEKQIDAIPGRFEKQRLDLVSSLESCEKEAKRLKQKIRSIAKDVKPSKVIESHELVRSLNRQIHDATSEISSLERERKTYERSTEILGKHDWFETNDACKQCSFLSDAWKAVDALADIESSISKGEEIVEAHRKSLRDVGFTEDQIIEVKSLADLFRQEQMKVEMCRTKLDSVDNEALSEISSCRSILESTSEDLQTGLSDAEQQIGSLEGMLESTKKEREKMEQRLSSEKERLVTELGVAEENLEAYRAVFEALEAQRDMLKELEKEEALSTSVSDKIDDLQRTFFSEKATAAKYQGEMSAIEDNVAEIVKLREALSSYKLYLSAVNKRGVPMELLKLILPRISEEANAIITQTQDWSISIKIVEDDLEINLIDAGELERPIECASGAERVMTSIALRVGLSRVSFLPKPNFIVIDEGFGALDVDAVGRAKSFLSEVKSHFDFIVIISHWPQMVDMVDSQWTIDKSDGFSKIVVG